MLDLPAAAGGFERAFVPGQQPNHFVAWAQETPVDFLIVFLGLKIINDSTLRAANGRESFEDIFGVRGIDLRPYDAHARWNRIVLFYIGLNTKLILS